MIRFKQNMQVANVVLAAVNATLNEDDDTSRLYIEAYANGREHGYFIAGWYVNGKTLGIAFSENRNSDNIVVYVGDRQNFDSQGNIPDEAIYRKARYFAPGAYQEAADFIVERIRNAVSAQSPVVTA